ncbi:MAG TPA: hypothetical protein VFA56_03105 [Gaiellaceae bacterium]|nr:hypothetical protein [Gaiellaceae bacterium]
MTPDAWPSPDTPPAALPRIEDLPIVDQGYEQEAVRSAFDSFYRHAAQLDATLRALEAVEAFRRDADALRNDLRALQAVGFGASAPDPLLTASTYERPRAEVPAVVWRLAGEVALLVSIAVIAGVAHFRTVVVVVLMAAAFLVVALVEWLASRARFVPPAVAFLPPLETVDEADGEPAPYVEAPAPWAQPALEPAEDTEADVALAIVEPVDGDPWEDAPHDGDVVDEDDAAAADDDDEPPAEADSDEAPAEGLDEPEAELVERGGIFRRRRR